MSRQSRIRSTAWLFAIAAAMGCGMAFLTPSTKPAPIPAIIPIATENRVDPASPAVNPITPVSAAKSAPLRLRDGSAKMPEAPAFVERAAGVFEASGPRYSALLSAGSGLRYLPRTQSGKSSELRVHLKRVTRGDFAVYDRDSDENADSEVAVARGSGGLSYWRTPSFHECYDPRGDGIEQSFLLDSKPAGIGDLLFALDMEMRDLVALPPRAARHGGILFADKSGEIAVRYGQIMVRDASGKSLVVEPILDVTTGSAHFAVSSAWLDAATYPVVVDPLVGTDFAISDSTNNPVGVDQPTVCAGNNNYLVAWTDYSSGAALPQVVGAIVSQSGSVSAAFAISSNVSRPLPWRFQRIECAFDGANWLVVWADVQSASPGVRGAIVGASGTLLGGTDFLISATSGTVSEDPLAAYNGSNFVVAWTDTPASLSGGSQVYYTFVNSNGVAAKSAPLKSNFTVINQSLEYMTTQRPNGDTLILYQELNETPAIHRSVRIQTSGILSDPGGTALFKEDQVASDGTTGYGKPIGAVFNTTVNEWQILSSYSATENSKIFLHHLSLTGTVTPPTGVFAVVGVGPIGNPQLDGFAPAFAGANEWLFLRNERINSTVYHVLGKRVGFDGTDKDPIPFQIDSATRGIIRNGVAAQGGNLFLVAWLDGRNSNAQPADRISIAAALVDATAANSVGIPLIAAATASPTSGEIPLTVGFDSTASTGSPDTVTWDFGDGTTSTLASPSHIYKSNGTYIAQLKLTKGAYSVFDTVVIKAGTGGVTGQSTVIGTPLTNTPPIIPGLFISSANVKLDYFNLSNDSSTIAGFFDVSPLNNNLTGQIASISLGGKTFAFTLDAKGTFKTTTGTTQLIAFAISPKTGAFLFTVTAASLRSDMAALGMTNDTFTTSIPVTLPITVSVGTLQAQANVGTEYHSKKNVNGAANYGFQATGSEISGAFLISAFTAQEASTKSHTFTITGQLVRPGTFKPDVNGNFKINVGNYQATIPGGAILNKGGILTYTAKLTSGVKKFTFNIVTGVFAIQLMNISQDANVGGTGLPLAKSGTDIVKVDMNVSFLFDLSDGTKLSAGRYAYIGRANAAAKSWKLR